MAYQFSSSGKKNFIQVTFGFLVNPSQFLTGMIDSVSKFSLNGTNSNGAKWSGTLIRFSRTGKKGKISVKYPLFFDRAGKNSAVKQSHTGKSQPFFLERDESQKFSLIYCLFFNRAEKKQKNLVNSNSKLKLFTYCLHMLAFNRANCVPLSTFKKYSRLNTV